ncbi:MAG: HAD-IIIC family phosphatase [Limisphaerales bacterium]
MDKRPLRCLVISDFNTSNFAAYLENDEQSPLVEVLDAPFGQVIPLLTNLEASEWAAQPDFTIIWTQPERVILGFQSILEHKAIPLAEILAEVEAFAELILAAAQKTRCVFIPNWILDPNNRGSGMANFRGEMGIRSVLMQMNLRLIEKLQTASNVFVLDSMPWLVKAGSAAFAPKLWYQAKVPLHNTVFQEAVQDIKAGLVGFFGGARKLIVLDLDETLWGGIVGDVGWENLRLGGHDPVGEAFVDFQRELKALTNRGLVLGIVSKNDESVALTAIKQHPEMVLKIDQFAGWRINWQDKAANIIELAAELNLGLQSVVFIDDNPVERGRVREALPEVFVPEWPETPMLYRQALLGLRCFDTPSLSKEDAVRTDAYVAERKRTDLKKQAGSLDEWLLGLNIEVVVEPVTPQNLSRTVQLLNKTNQMNLSTRRLSEAELQQWLSVPGNVFGTFRVSDKYGDSGLTGIASLTIEGTKARVVDYILSCRVMGRRVEETLVHWLVTQARCAGVNELSAEYLPTAKNKPCLEFFQRSGLAQEGNTFRWAMQNDYALPQCVRLITSPA